jgi:NAD+ kinase
MARRPRVLVVYKKEVFPSPLTRTFKQLAQQGQRRYVRELLAAQALHEQAVERVLAELKQFPIAVTVRSRTQLHPSSSFDYAIAVGGDGTFLKMARCAQGALLFGVNSSPNRSEAVYSCATPETFSRYFERALAGQLSVLALPRLQLQLNGKRQEVLALNDLLITHPHPAVTSRYEFKIGTATEVQKSSGLWIATASGSTGGVAAGGGERLDWRLEQFQYRPRELYVGRLSAPRLKGGVLPAHQAVELVWLLHQGVVCVDGAHLKIALRFADRLKVSLDLKHPVRVLGK